MGRPRGRRGITFRIDQGKIRPSKALADAGASLLAGNPEFTMTDDQKVVSERALHLAETTSGDRKRDRSAHRLPPSASHHPFAPRLMRGCTPRATVAADAEGDHD